MSTGSSSVGKSFNRRVQYLGEAAPAWSEGSGTFWATSHVPSSGFGCQRILHVKSVKELKTFTQKTHVNTMSSCTRVHYYLYLWVILHTNLICFQKKDIGLLLLLQLVLPEVIPLQLMLDDVHTQGPNLKMCDQAVELGETREEIKMERERERKRLPFIQKWILKNVFGGIPAGSCHWNDPIRHPSSSLHSKLSKSKHVQSNSMSWSDL